VVRLSDEQIWEIARAYSFGSDSVEGHKAIADAQLRAVVEDLERRAKNLEEIWGLLVIPVELEQIADEYEAELEEASE